RRLSAVEVVEACLERIAALDGRLGAFQLVRDREVLAEAEALDAREDLPALPLAGVPVSVKDMIDVAGAPTTDGSRAGSDAPAAADDELVARLRRAGALVVGKTRVPEFGLWPFTESEAFGATRNPWNPGLTPGGSTGGGAAAVSAAMTALALGSDGGGSIRIPAACCGLVGLKPGTGVVPLPGGRTPARSLVEWGPLGTSVADVSVMFEVLAGLAGQGEVAPPARALRIAVSARPPVAGVPVDAAMRRALRTTAEVLSGAGHDVVVAHPPHRPADVAAFLKRFLAGPAERVEQLGSARVEPRTRGAARVGRLLGRPPPSPRAQERIRDRFRRWFADHDVLLTPVLARPPIPVGAFEGRGFTATLLGSTRFVPFPAPWNLTGFPAASVPAPPLPGGIPTGVQLVAAPGGERLLLSVARQLEQLQPWPRHAPLDPGRV
ncbi:MAG: amidase family protein, partial [Actinomycetota bacterium]|nr:amidase family protein [Actinomycetota bacterium]